MLWRTRSTRRFATSSRRITAVTRLNLKESASCMLPLLSKRYKYYLPSCPAVSHKQWHRTSSVSSSQSQKLPRSQHRRHQASLQARWQRLDLLLYAELRHNASLGSSNSSHLSQTVKQNHACQRQLVRHLRHALLKGAGQVATQLGI